MSFRIATPAVDPDSHAGQRQVSSETVRRAAAAPTDGAEGDGTQRSDDRLTRVDGAKHMPPVPGARAPPSRGMTHARPASSRTNWLSVITPGSPSGSPTTSASYVKPG